VDAADAEPDTVGVDGDAADERVAEPADAEAEPAGGVDGVDDPPGVETVGLVLVGEMPCGPDAAWTESGADAPEHAVSMSAVARAMAVVRIGRLTGIPSCQPENGRADIVAVALLGIIDARRAVPVERHARVRSTGTTRRDRAQTLLTVTTPGA